jgi:hypothetical protein
MNCIIAHSRIVTVAAALLMGPPALAQTTDRAPVDLPAAQLMTPGGGESWTYLDPDAVFTKYRTVMVDPGTVYDGPDAQFNDVDPADRAKYADIMATELRTEIAKTFPSATTIDQNTLRVHINLVGVQKTKGGLATATRVTPIGLGLSALKAVRGKQGTFTGSVLYAVEAYDAKTGKLLLAAVRRRTPDPLDIPATLSTTDTVKAVARDFAASARKRLEEMTQTQPRQ